MGQSELQQSYKDWAKRIGLYESQGISANVYGPIAKQDMQRTYSEDSYPMSDLEANIAVAAAASKTPPVQESPRGTGEKGLSGIVGRIASNVVPDIGNLITALPRGVFDLGKAVVTPSSYTDTAKLLFGSNEDPALAKNFAQAGVDPTQYDQSGGAFSLKNFGATARLVATDPLLSWIPGVSDLAGATTPQGRQSLEQHPVSTVLDLAGDVGGLSKIAGTEALARSGEVGKLADSGVDINDPKALDAALKKDPSAKAALAGGHVVQGAARGIDRAISGRMAGGLTPDILSATSDELGKGQKLARSALRKLKLDRTNKLLSKEASRISRTKQVEVRDFVRQRAESAFKPLGDDPVAIESYFNKAQGLTGEGKLPTDGEPAGVDAMNDAERATYWNHTKLRDDLRAKYGTRLTDAEEGMFPNKSPAASKYRALSKASTAERTAKTKLSTAEELLNRRKGEFDESLARHKRPLKGVSERLQSAQTSFDKANSDATAASTKVKTANDIYHKQLLRTPPAHLTGIMREFMKNQAADHIKLAQAGHLDTMNEMLKDLENTTYIKDLKQYLGKEYAPLLSDSLEYAMQQTRDGHPPLYIHSVRTGQESSALSSGLKTLTPHTLMAKGFNVGKTMMNAELGVVSEYANLAQEEGGLELLSKMLVPNGKYGRNIDKIYEKHAEGRIAAGRTRYTSVGDLKSKMRDSEWVHISPKTGVRLHTLDSPDNFYVPKDLYENWEHWAGRKGGKMDTVWNNKFYSGSMKLFRTSVLYGPRHFVHVVIGGMAPLMMADPAAITNFVKIWPELRKMWHGGVPDLNVIPTTARAAFDYKTDADYSHEMDRRIGGKYGTLLTKYWKSIGAPIGNGMAKVEDFAQTMYQSAEYLQGLKRGEDPTVALEGMRRMVVNMDDAAPFERTIMKQIMPFYSFTRFAVQYLFNLPFDHPLRTSILSSLSNQAQEEWGTGLPMDMMDLFFIGSPTSTGNESTVNLKNVNPFRSIANEFTLGGFVSSLNPGVEAIAGALGVNTLSGSGEMYPEISFNPQTGDLETTRPSGDLWTAIESYVPQLQALDAHFGLSDSLRSLKQDDPAAYNRELWSWFNLPFTPSSYNMNQVRGNTALNLYKGASQAMQDAQRTGNFTGNINRYNLVPMMSPSGKNELYTPSAVESYYKSLSAQYANAEPGINPAAVNPYTS